MKFSYTEVWNDTVRLIQANLAILVALAGVFIFLPTLLIIHFFPPPTEIPPENALRIAWAYWMAILPWAFLSQLVQMIGGISIYLILLGKRGSTVGGVIATSLVILPFYFLASFLSGFIIFAGMILFIVPGFYLIARILPLGPVIVAEGVRNPIDAIRRSFAVSAGNGWAILGLLLLVAIPGWIVGRVVVLLLGILFTFLASTDIADLLTQIVQAIATSALSLIIVVMVAALYRTLAGPKSAAD